MKKVIVIVNAEGHIWSQSKNIDDNCPYFSAYSTDYAIEFPSKAAAEIDFEFNEMPEGASVTEIEIDGY